MLQWNSKASVVLVIAILATLASFNGFLGLPEALNFAW
jgi:hypothetical protein